MSFCYDKVMNTYVVLIRGINVGGNNKVPMAVLRECLLDAGFSDVQTYIASGNVILKTDKSPTDTKDVIEELLPKKFKLNSDLIKVLILTNDQIYTVVKNKPEGFGEEPEKYNSDAIFLMNVPVDTALDAFSPKEGVDKVWEGDGVIYSQRLTSEKTKSRLGKIISSPLYKSMTIRSWNTTSKLFHILQKEKEEESR